MDRDLLLSLILMWISTTTALVVFLDFWFGSDGEAFHPHCVDVERRHSKFLVVSTKTCCKKDCAVKSISAFVSPRGASSSKFFTVLCVALSVAGMLGTSRWYYVGDAAYIEMILSGTGFASLLMVAAFELDVGTGVFLRDKLIVTGWLIEKLGVAGKLSFSLSPSDSRFMAFLRKCPDLYHLYEEDRVLLDQEKCKRVHMWSYHPVWSYLHMFGAILYVFLVPSAILLNDRAADEVFAVTALAFTLFSFLGYLTGNYMPVLPYFKGWILPWNPFLKEPHFMLKLKRAVETFCDEAADQLQPETAATTSALEVGSSGNSLSSYTNGKPMSDKRKKKMMQKNNSLMRKAAAEADCALDNIFLRYARKDPRQYLLLVGRVIVMSELIALLTPSVAMGLQWITALCGEVNPIEAIIDLVSLGATCVLTFGIDCSLHSSEFFSSCILREGMAVEAAAAASAAAAGVAASN